jgi:adenine C2-methylase RlmN of 23S rRNA A2503 and tRNA A37
MEKKIKHYFFGEYQGKIAICVSPSGLAQHIESLIKGQIVIQLAIAGFIVNISLTAP